MLVSTPHLESKATPVVLELEGAAESLRGLARAQKVGPTPGVSDLVGRGWAENWHVSQTPR